MELFLGKFTELNYKNLYIYFSSFSEKHKKHLKGKSFKSLGTLSHAMFIITNVADPSLVNKYTVQYIQEFSLNKLPTHMTSSINIKGTIRIKVQSLIRI